MIYSSHMNQSRALDILKTGANVFLTGEPGSGKTYVINKYIAWLEAAGLSVAVTASTGIAATHIGGMTIHSWSGVGARDTLTHYDLDQIMGREKTVRRIKKAHVLIIDEISMLDGKMLDMVEVVCRTARARGDVFGGLQVVLVGDFFQLPPVTRQGDMMRYAFESHAWDNMRPLICYLSDQFRQEDETLLGLLSSIRRGEIEDDHFTLLNEQTEIAYENVEPTRLYTHNADVDQVNASKLAALGGKSRTFTMAGRGSKALLESLVKTCLSPDTLILKEDAMVMCTKNNFDAGYVNGTLGRVIAFDNDTTYPIVETADGVRIIMAPQSWDVIEDGKIKASIEQIPLRLAWAITIHKSQGMSLDAVEVDLSKAFVYGQGYVALSRVRTLAGLKVLGMHPNALQVDPKIIRRDATFRSDSSNAEDTFVTLDGEELVRMHTQFVQAGGGKIPTAAEARSTKAKLAARVAKGSTFAETKELVMAGKLLPEIAKAREMALTTIVGHIEKLAEEGQLSDVEIRRLITGIDDVDAAIADVREAVAHHGNEKLKPLYEATGERYPYDVIRLIRLLKH
jgi:ATP-dependent DNA helicase PIF1